jgi:hypothetical protein
MNTAMTAAVAAERVADIHRAAQTHRRAHDATATPAPARTRCGRPPFARVTAKRPHPNAGVPQHHRTTTPCSGRTCAASGSRRDATEKAG